MALYTYHHDAPTITAAGREWVQRCLVRDGSILGEGAISTAANYDVLDRHFLQRLMWAAATSSRSCGLSSRMRHPLPAS